MKKQKTNKNGKGHSQTIRIEFTDAVTVSVAIAVTFRDCRPDATPMVRISPGPLGERGPFRSQATAE